MRIPRPRKREKRTSTKVSSKPCRAHTTRNPRQEERTGTTASDYNASSILYKVDMPQRKASTNPITVARANGLDYAFTQGEDTVLAALAQRPNVKQIKK